MIYLDLASTTKPKQEVVEAMLPYLIDMWQNPSSLYNESVKIKKDIEAARDTIGKFIGANGDEIFMTSGGSESNCWAIQGFINRHRRRHKDITVITSAIEHKSIMECVKHMNVDVHYVGVDKNGFIDMRLLEILLHEAYLESNEIIASIQFANNEIGTIQNIRSIAELVHKYDGVFHSDAVQAVGQTPIDVKELGVDLLSCSGHKLHASKGVGFLYKRNGVEIDPLIYGSQMDGMRGGTESVAHIIGMAKAIELCDIKDDNLDDMCKKRDYFIGCLEEKFGCKLNGHCSQRLANNINVTFPQNITGESLLYMLDLSGIQISTGSACNSKEIKPSYVLKAIGLTDEEAMKTIRISISDDITYEEIDYVIEEIGKAIKLIES